MTHFKILLAIGLAAFFAPVPVYADASADLNKLLGDYRAAENQAPAQRARLTAMTRTSRPPP